MPERNSSSIHYQIVAYASGICALLVCLIVGISVYHGTGYQDFESMLRFGDIEIYNEKIAEALPVLRSIYPIDTLYIFGYLIMVFSMVQVVQNRKTLGLLSMIAVVVLAFLDFVENNHILAMANNAALGLRIEASQVTLETVITQTKFNFGLLLTLMISFLIPDGTRTGMLARWFARFLVLCAPVAILTPTTTLLYITMNVALGAVISVVYAREKNPVIASST